MWGSPGPSQPDLEWFLGCQSVLSLSLAFRREVGDAGPDGRSGSPVGVTHEERCTSSGRLKQRFGGDQQRIQILVPRDHQGVQYGTHSGVPEPIDMSGDRGRCGVGIQLAELPGDVIAHPDFGHQCGHCVCTRSPLASARAAVSREVTTPTWTAVTLYSGQFVAQSEFSVVTTLAPVTGWWKVV